MCDCNGGDEGFSIFQELGKTKLTPSSHANHVISG